jgi:hypothetical protein
MKQSLQPGDRVAYSAKFLRNTCQFSGAAPQRRGSFVQYDPNGFGRVHWDDEAQRIAEQEGQFADQDYCNEIAAHGSLVHANNIAKVGSPRFSCNDL